MKPKIYRLFLLSLLFTGIMILSCADLNVENLNEPDFSRVFTNPDDLMNFAGGTFKTIHNAAQGDEGPALSMGGMADQTSCPWCCGMFDLGREPRVGFVNQKNHYNQTIVTVPWGAFYSAISSVNDVLRAIDGGLKFDGNPSKTKMVEAWCYFVSGIAHSYLGLIYDKGNVQKFDTDVSKSQLVPWQDVIDGALSLLDKAIAIADANDFTIPVSWMAGQAIDNKGLSKLANSYAARTMVYGSRNRENAASLDWSKVLTYTENGITTDFAPLLGNTYGWYDYYFVYQTMIGWGRVDCRIINIFNHSYPSRWANGNTSGYGQPTSADARLLSDFEYLSAQNFPPDRGYYWFSSYRFKRYDNVTASVLYGNKPKPSFLAWENEMLKAEAFVRTGNISGAVTILNSPTGARKVRGLLPDVTAATAGDILRIIWDEKDIELFDTGMGIGFFDMRRTDRLLSGTILHFPAPATELEISNIPLYTISGAPDGVNISNGGWIGYTK
jgi:hypothetical protein